MREEGKLALGMTIKQIVKCVLELYTEGCCTSPLTPIQHFRPTFALFTPQVYYAEGKKYSRTGVVKFDAGVYDSDDD